MAEATDGDADIDSDSESDFDYSSWEKPIIAAMKKSFKAFEDFNENLTWQEWKVRFPTNTLNCIVGEFIGHELLNRVRCKGIATIAFKDINHAFFRVKKRFGKFDKKSGYSGMSDDEAIRGYKASAEYSFMMAKYSTSLGKPSDSCKQANGLFKVDYEKRLKMSTGIGTFGKRTDAFLACVTSTDIGPRPGSW